MRPFATDDELAVRVRAVARELRREDVADGAGRFGALALELEAVALILDPEETPAVTAVSFQPRLPFV